MATLYSKRLSQFNHRVLEKNIKNFRLLFYAILVGILAGGIGALFRLSLQGIETLKTATLSYFKTTTYTEGIVGCLLCILSIYVSLLLVKKFAPEASGSGIQEVEGALDEIKPLRWKRVLPIKFIASLFSLSSGLLLGREGPTIQLGANIGKMVKDIFKQPNEENNPLISTGSAAGLASAFNAPFSGILFVIEEMNGHFKFNFFSVACIMLGASVADIVVRYLLGSSAAIEMQVFSFDHISMIWMFVLLGLIFSGIGLLFNSCILKTLDLFKYFKKHPLLISIVLGIIITLVGMYATDMITAGYNTIDNVLKNSFSLRMLLLLLGVRFILSIISYASGVPGGIFAPLLTLGVVVGMLFGVCAQALFPEQVPNPAIFAVAGMAGIFASTVRAPLTGVALAVEMTANFGLILPLILTTATAAICTTVLGNEPIYTSLLRRSIEELHLKKRRDI